MQILEMETGFEQTLMEFKMGHGLLKDLDCSEASNESGRDRRLSAREGASKKAFSGKMAFADEAYIGLLK